MIRALEMAETKRVSAHKKHGVMPVMSEPADLLQSPQEFYDWLEEHHETETEVYVGFYKCTPASAP